MTEQLTQNVIVDRKTGMMKLDGYGMSPQQFILPARVAQEHRFRPATAPIKL